MALFKIFRGPENGLKDVPLHDGYAYFTEDQGNLYIDIGEKAGDRVRVNAYYAEELRNIKADGSVEYIAFDDIELKSATKDVAHGGTGQTTLTANAILMGNGTNAIKMTIIDNDEILVGDTANGIRGLTGTGALYKLANGAPQFGTLPISLGGTNATTEAQARQNLDVYNKKEVDDKVAGATAKAYETTLNVGGWTSQGDKFQFNYSNAALTCGVAGDVPPTITYVSNLDEYSKIEEAVATPGTGIVFTIAEKPKEDIKIIIIDKG